MARRDRHPDLDRPQNPVSPPVVNEFFKFADSSHPDRILLGLHKQWTEGRFLDITVRVNDVRVRAHKSVLSAFSGYFEGLFNSNMSDAGRDEINLSDNHVSESVIRLLIEFAYCGSLDITPENVQDLLYAANFLCIDTVISACCTYLQDNLSLENCTDVLEVAVSLDKHQLLRNTESFIVSHFEEFVQQEIFLKLPVRQLVGVLERDELNVLENGFFVSRVEQEEKILKVILRFVETRPEVNREHLLLLLVRGVRLMLLPSSVLMSLKSSHWIMTSPECLKLVNRVLSSEVSSEEQKLWERPRLYMVEYEKSEELATIPTVQSEAPTIPFDDGHLVQEGEQVFVTGMKIYTRNWYTHHIIGGMEVFYNTGKSVLHGTAGYGYEDSEFHLDFDERIISVTARIGHMVDQLTFTTNRGNTFGPSGGNGGSEHQLRCQRDGAYLAYISGTVDVTGFITAVRRLRFVWGFHKISS